MKKVAVVTGGSVGIGKAIAKEFAKNNYNIVITYNTHEQEAEQLKKELESKYNIEVLKVKVDLSVENDIFNLNEQITSRFSQIDVLINNAALTIDNYISEKTYTEFQNVINVNLTGTFLCTKLLSKLISNGTIINIASTNGIDTYNSYSIDYDASKAGIISLTHNFAKELAPNIRVNAIAPGWVATESVLSMDPKIIEDEKNKIMLKRFGTPEEIAKLAFFIVAEGTYINNSIIRIDGGTINGN